ncbi:hypothetical protein ACFFWC_07845 [Plantactinospora siamensis]|uniref:ATP synthase protein I n=1 Tax=Plantactinospora siamensis TaxID=555372 RepID=A0ABV6NXL1_9ACTN
MAEPGEARTARGAAAPADATGAAAPAEAAAPGEAAAPAEAGGPAGVAEVGGADRRWRTRHLRPLLAFAAVVTGLAAAVGGLLAGGSGAAGTASGVVLVTLSYLASTLVIAHADAVNPRLVLPVGLAAYVVKLSVLAAVFFAVAATGWGGLVPFSLGVVAGVVGWTGAHIWWVTTVHARRA